jgi:hypothetical protein
VDVRLPRPFAVMDRDWWGEWRQPVLNGIASAPLLREDGLIDCRPVYDATSGIWRDPGAMHKNSAWCSTAFNLSKFRWSLSAVTST